jgi:hypothetical protein
VLSFPNYAAALLPRLGDLPTRLSRRLRLQTTPKPVAHVALDALDDATVLASVEACLHALAAHPAVRTWQQTLAEAAETGEAEAVREVLQPTPSAARDARSTPFRPGPGTAAHQDADRERGPSERPARAAGLRRADAPAPAVAPRPSAAPPPASRPAPAPPPGRPMRASAPPGLLLPKGPATPGAPAADRRR